MIKINLKYYLIYHIIIMAIPIKIGNYKLGKTLGSGSFGKVKGNILTYNIFFIQILFSGNQ